MVDAEPRYRAAYKMSDPELAVNKGRPSRTLVAGIPVADLLAGTGGIKVDTHHVKPGGWRKLKAEQTAAAAAKKLKGAKGKGKHKVKKRKAMKVMKAAPAGKVTFSVWCKRMHSRGWHQKYQEHILEGKSKEESKVAAAVEGRKEAARCRELKASGQLPANVEY